MKLSLIIATLGRSAELERLFTSLAEQTCQDFEAIVVDQNPDDRLEPLLQTFRARFPLVHLRSPAGVSKARNRGLRSATGEVIGFPDDDCWYAPEFLRRVVDHLDLRREAAGCSGPARDPRTGEWFGRYPSVGGPITRRNVFRSAVSFTLFFRREALKAAGDFDETLGVGSGTPWQSGEETDLLIRVLDRGFRIEYLPELEAYHVNKIAAYDAAARDRTLRYSRGCGRVLRKHGFHPLLVLSALARPLAGTLLALISGRIGKSLLHANIFRGRLAGFLAREPFAAPDAEPESRPASGDRPGSADAESEFLQSSHIGKCVSPTRSL